MRQEILRIAFGLALLFMVTQQILLGLLQAPVPDSQHFLRESKISANAVAARPKIRPSSNTDVDVVASNKQPRVLLFITTIFSDRHVDYLSCCWPRLMEASNFLNSVDVMIFSNNETEIPSSTIDMTRQLFSNNPNFEFQFASTAELEELHQATTQKNILFQMGANLGVKLGFSKGWFLKKEKNNNDDDFYYDWVIRINPDVLIRNSTWLAKEAIVDEALDGIFAKCSDEPTLRIHTDFFAFRPRALPSGDAFSKMAVQPHTTNLYNHEYTAYKEFSPILDDNKKFRFLPNIAPSNGFCRLRGDDAPIYHGHESCRQYDNDHQEQPYICNALEGWPIT